MFATETGLSAANAIGNETRTLAAFYRFTTELLADVLEKSSILGPRDRLLVTGGTGNRPPVL
jgi:hypothetical protein